MATNLPVQEAIETSQEVRQFFDKFYESKISFPVNQIDAVVGFFLKSGFDVESARSTAIVLLNQAKVDNVNVFQLVDTLSGLTDVQLGQVVAQVLNAYRVKTSVLGFKVASNFNTYESRNIVV